jgi:putative DNA primase/helicase
MTTPFNCTETGNAERFVARFRDEVAYCSELGGWHVYRDGRWQRDEDGTVEYLAKLTVRSIYGEAEGEDDSAKRKAIADWAKKSESANARRAMLDLAKSEPKMRISQAEFDTNPFLLNCINGTLDLKTGELLDHNPDDLLTKIAPVKYDPSAKSPVWENTLCKVFGGDIELVEFLQRAAGYSLTGDTREQCFFILHGSGSNGKSTVIDTLRHLMGDYGRGTPSETFIVKRSAGINNDVARLRGARFVTAIETDEGKRLSEGLIKEMTGGDVVTARYLHKEYFDFKPEYKIFLATNHEPEIRGTDEGIWRRVRKIPFNVRFWNPDKDEHGDPQLRADKQLVEKLQAEREGIFAWMVEGCGKWQCEGLPVPQAVIAATAKYREEQDELAGFIKDRCNVGEGCKTTVATLRTAYEHWCKEGGEHPIQPRQFSARMREKGFEEYRSKKSRGWNGIEVCGV